ncbi:MAG TPA: hypothetical protein VIH34_02155, partial [Candidatus Bathyarchaeia archaeon]
WLGLKFLSKDDQEALGLTRTTEEQVDTQTRLVEPVNTMPQSEDNLPELNGSRMVRDDSDRLTFNPQSDAPACDNCGMIMVRNGSCYKCLNCGNTTGCG